MVPGGRTLTQTHQLVTLIKKISLHLHPSDLWSQEYAIVSFSYQASETLHSTQKKIRAGLRSNIAWLEDVDTTPETQEADGYVMATTVENTTNTTHGLPTSKMSSLNLLPPYPRP